MIVCPHRSRERILAFSIGGGGKTHAALQVLRDALAPGQTGWYIETDPTLDRMLEDPEFAGLQVREEFYDGEADDSYTTENGQLVVYHCTSWNAVKDAIVEVWSQAERDDWIVVDNGTKPWDWVQSHYWITVIGVEDDEFLLNLRKAQLADDNEKGRASEGKFNEWSFINPHYFKHFNDKIINPPCHLIVTAHQTEYVAAFDDKQKEVAGLYSQHGVKPKGQKELGGMTHTVLWLTKSKGGEHRMTTIKDRGGRHNYTREVWDDFAQDYLVAVAGWVEEDEWTSNTSPEAPLPQASPEPNTKVKVKVKAKR
jgi:hypothetical protein